MKKNYDLVNDTVKVALVTSSYTLNTAHTVFGDITNEISGTGYSAGGATLASKTVGTVAEGAFDAADTSWTTSSITNARAAIVYDTTYSSKLICYVDFGANYTTVSGTFLITWAAAGILTMA